MQINVLEPFQVNFYWPTVERFIQASQDRGPVDMTMAELRECCASDERWRLLIFDRFQGAAILRAWDGWLHVVAIGGTFEPGWMDEFFPYLMRLAKFFGMSHITLGGRKGWKRALRRLGFVPLQGPYLGCPVPKEDD